MTLQITTPVALTYKRSVLVSICQQLFLIIWSALAVDGGQMVRCAMLSLPVYWLMVITLILRRGNHPSRGDLVAIRYGYFFVFAGMVIFSLLWWQPGRF